MIKQFVAQCIICQQPKPKRVKYPSLLQPLLVPNYAWQVVSLDFVEGSYFKQCQLHSSSG